MKKSSDATANSYTQLTTRWTKSLTTGPVLAKYPRPELARASYLSLNGMWDYAFTNSDRMPASFEGQIRVPFSPESLLSGVSRQLQPDQYLWYHRQVTLPADFCHAGHLLLHFGAVDQLCVVYVGGTKVGSHDGGYLPFTLELTSVLKAEYTARSASGASSAHDLSDHAADLPCDASSDDSSVTFDLTVCVQDLSDTSWKARGKQKLQRGGMFYTAQSGIWQSVWMEAVPKAYVQSLRIDTDFDAANGTITAALCMPDISDANVRIVIRPESEQDRVFRDLPSNDWPVTEDTELPLVDLSIPIETSNMDDCENKTVFATFELPDFHPWSPEGPFLYHVVLILKTGNTTDTVHSYFAMRKCDIQTDAKGIRRIFLNNKPYMQMGVLDQGYWPDGLYTAPSDEALVYDIQTMKELGFNMLRKHIKIEPDRWYYHCDRLGMLVWQDMVCGGTSYKHWFVTYIATAMNSFHISFPDGEGTRHLLSRKDFEGQVSFQKEVAETIRVLRCHPSIVCWVPFNEAWGQFDAAKMAQYVRNLDSSRIIDHASGWFDQGAGDLQSLHYYFFKFRFHTEPVRACAITEYGGYSWQIPGHCYSQKLYGYGKYDSKQSLTEGYEALHRDIIVPAVKEGISATIYTQLSDIEEETNGLLTYDREIIKIDADAVRKWNAAMKRAVSGDN